MRRSGNRPRCHPWRCWLPLDWLRTALPRGSNIPTVIHQRGTCRSESANRTRTFLTKKCMERGNPSGTPESAPRNAHKCSQKASRRQSQRGFPAGEVLKRAWCASVVAAIFCPVRRGFRHSCGYRACFRKLGMASQPFSLLRNSASLGAGFQSQRPLARRRTTWLTISSF